MALRYDFMPFDVTGVWVNKPHTTNSSRNGIRHSVAVSVAFDSVSTDMLLLRGTANKWLTTSAESLSKK